MKNKNSFIRIIISGSTVIAFTALAIWAVIFYWKNLRGVWPAIRLPGQRIENLANSDSDFLNLPEGFSISIFAKDLPGSRDVVFDGMDNLLVSRTREGVITMIKIKEGKAVGQDDIFSKLNNPHGLAIDPETPFLLYFAEEDKISRVMLYSGQSPQKIADLPEGGGHFTRSLIFGSDGRLYVSIGSSCNVCNEEDNRRAKIFVMEKDGSDFKEFSRGLRNAVFMAVHPGTGKIWATEMGRDLLGDNLPPDEINIIEEGKNYGWPICYGKNIYDANFDKNVYIRNPCMEPFEAPSHIDMPAHSAPLGLAFFPESWPEEYRNDLLVAYHGSWNRTEPTGYKIVRIKLDEQGSFSGELPEIEDFISGWLKNGEALGRPVDILIASDGIYISDDKAGVIYKVEAL